VQADGCIAYLQDRVQITQEFLEIARAGISKKTLSLQFSLAHMEALEVVGSSLRSRFITDTLFTHK